MVTSICGIWEVPLLEYSLYCPPSSTNFPSIFTLCLYVMDALFYLNTCKYFTHNATENFLSSWLFEKKISFGNASLLMNLLSAQLKHFYVYVIEITVIRIIFCKLFFEHQIFLATHLFYIKCD